MHPASPPEAAGTGSSLPACTGAPVGRRVPVIVTDVYKMLLAP